MSESVQVPETHQYMKPSQTQQLQQEIDGLRAQIANPTPGGADKGEMQKRIRRMEQTLSRHTPPALTPAQRDAYAREEKALRDEFVPDMLSGETMRKNPAGAVDRQIAFHNRHKRRIARWKNIVRALDPQNDSPDLCNIERFRPHSRPSDNAMHDVQIAGKTFVGLDGSPAYKEGWERTFGNGAEEPAAAAAAPAKAKRPPPQPEKVAMPCGEMKDPRGRRWHVQKCEACQRAMAAGGGEAA